MGALRKTLRVVLWSAAVIVAIPVLLNLAVLAINWRDQPPSREALALSSALGERPEVADGDNAYVFLLGFSASRDRDPAALGAERAAWIRAMRDDPSVTWGSDPARKEGATGPGVYQSIRGFLCDPDAACDALLDGKRNELNTAVASEAWALERYRRLLAHRAWTEVTTRDLRTPWPEFSPVSEARSLYLLDARLRAETSDVEGVREALDADLEFWRLVLRESNLLLDKALAESFIRRHFQWGNLILRQLPPAARADAIPASWRRPLSDDERSMTRAFRGEWDYVANSVRETKDFERLQTALDVPYSPTSLDRINTRLATALLQPQDSANQYGALFVGLEPVLNVPYSELAASLSRAHTVDERRHGLRALYNITGNQSMAERSVFIDYGARVADLEGVRRAALLAAELRARDVPVEAVPSAVALHDLRNPYTGEAFQWIGERTSIGVTGLQSSSNRYTEFLY